MWSPTWKAYCLLWICVFAVIYGISVIAIKSASADAKGSTTRFFLVIKAQLIMLLASVIIYKRTVALFEPHSNVKSDESYELANAPVEMHRMPNRKTASISRVIRLLAPINFARVVLLLFFIFAHCCFFMYYILVNDDPSWVALISFVSSAVYIHVAIFTIIAIAVELFAALIRVRPESTGMRRLLVDKNSHTLMAIGLALMLTFAGLFVTSQPPAVVEVSVPVENLPAELQGFKIALLTDLHIGPTVGRWRVQRIVDTTNKIEPDVVAIAGDLVDGAVHMLKGAAAPLATLKSKFGTFYSTGNHEYYHGNIDNWFTYLREIGVQPLHNEHKKIYVRKDSEHGICLAGVDDLTAAKARIPGHGLNLEKALAGCFDNETVVVLAHQPNAAKIILDGPLGHTVDLVLSGHTHGGQMYVLWPMAYFANAFFHGLYVHLQTGAHVYVSAGTNFWGPPVKMFGMCEITLLELRRA
uniref:Calcineurin-like phosphoesterase domain-containing protein n=1 Tax=Plectus sambesii TaxID=2011161 RepID=A0A914WK93_9BILA